MPKEDQLPEIFRLEERGVVMAADRTVPRPAASPRQLESKGQMALASAGVAAVLGLAGTALVFVALPGEAGAIRLVFAGLTALLFIAGVVVLAAEMGRVGEFRTRTFFPAILVYGSPKQFEKVVGPGGMGALTAAPIKASGRGLLSFIFDRAAHISASPEIVALLVDRGSGPEFVPVPWAAVNTIARGEIIWYYARSPYNYLFFHHLLPYAPQVSSDKETREEVFRALKVGRSMVKEMPKSAAMSGQTKAMKVDRDGNLVVDRSPEKPASQAAEAKTDQGLDANAMQAELARQRAAPPPPPPLGARPPAGRAPDRAPSQGGMEKFRIADAGKPLGGGKDPEDYGDDAGR